MGERCMSGTLPSLTGIRRIVQSPESVSIYSERGPIQRIIPMTTRPHHSPKVRRWWGDSRGHWEGQTLVVDVTNFTPKTGLPGQLTGSRADEKVFRRHGTLRGGENRRQSRSVNLLAGGIALP